jgi:hypothetical protein
MKLVPLLVAMLFVLSGCVETRPVSVAPAQASDAALSVAKAYMADRLKDPESMKIRRVAHFRTAEGDRIVCGEMDARNSFGGYNGYSTFYVRLEGNAVKRAHFGEDARWAAQAGCDQARTGVVQVAV